jgi:hypothetical protein
MGAPFLFLITPYWRRGWGGSSIYKWWIIRNRFVGGEGSSSSESHFWGMQSILCTNGPGGSSVMEGNSLHMSLLHPPVTARLPLKAWAKGHALHLKVNSWGQPPLFSASVLAFIAHRGWAGPLSGWEWIPCWTEAGCLPVSQPSWGCVCVYACVLSMSIYH